MSLSSNEDKLYVKIIVLNTVYNFIVEFFYLESFSVPNFNFSKNQHML